MNQNQNTHPSSPSGSNSLSVWVIAVSVGLMSLALWVVGPAEGIKKVLAFPLVALVAMLAMLFLNLFVVSLRFWRILAHFGCIVPWSVASRANLAGLVAGQFVISLFGQVAGRQLWLQNIGISPSVNAGLAAYERVVLLFVSGTFAAFGLAYLYGQNAIEQMIQNFSIVEIMLAACGGALLSLAIGSGRFEGNIARRLFVKRNAVRIVEIVGLTMVGQAILLATFVLGVTAFAHEIPLAKILASAAVISFAASMPITVNGWGVRELAAVYMLGKLGIPAADALAVSIVVGLCSTAVILVLAPFSLRKMPKRVPDSPVPAMPHSLTELEGATSWALAMAAVVAVHFQAIVVLPSGVINLNLADPFAILALAVVVLLAVFSGRLPDWRFKHVNAAMGIIGLLLLGGFFRGYLDIGITQWALGGRVFGWLVLLGYLSAGYLMVRNFGSHGLRRFIETLAAVACVIVFQQVAIRLMAMRGIDLGIKITANFEGYAGNRNAFSFQLIAIMALLLGYARMFRAPALMSIRSFAFPLILGTILLGIVLSGSRAGWGVSVILLALAWLYGTANLRKLGWSVGVALALWTLLWAAVYWTDRSYIGIPGMQSVLPGLQSELSGDANNLERWNLLIHAFNLWLQSPVFGIGLGVFYANSMTWLGYSQVIHSTPMWILTELGVIGLLVLGGLFLSLVRAIFMRKWRLPDNSALLMLLIAFLIFSLVHEIFFQRIFWLVLGALLAMRAVAWKSKVQPATAVYPVRPLPASGGARPIENKLRILVWHWGRRGGGPRYTLELARVLAARTDMDVFLSLSRQSEMYASFDDIPVAGRFDIDTYGSLPQFVLRSAQLPWLRHRFRRYLVQNRIDVVFCTMDHLWDAFMTGAIHEAGALYLLTVHDATRHPGEDQSWRRWLLGRDIAASDGALVLTRSVGASLATNYHFPRERTYLSTLGHFGDGTRESPRDMPSGRPIRLLFFGRILAYKGLDLLLEALPLLRAEFPRLELEIWGTGDLTPYRAMLEATPDVRVENRWIEEHEIAGIFERTDLAVLPYREASQSAVVATAFAAGMPCVATPIPGLCEQIADGETGVIAAGMTAVDFSNAIASVLRDPSLYRRLSTGCLHSARTALSWEAIGTSVAEALRSVQRQGRRAQTQEGQS